MTNLRLTVYRAFHRYVIEPWVLPRLFTQTRVQHSIRPEFTQLRPRSDESSSSSLLSGSQPSPGRIWFHAASVGELESLWPVVMQWAESGGELIVTVFSESAQGAAQKLRNAVAQTKGKALFFGYSPWEGRWLDSLRVMRPRVFVTAKYEAWPELWSALAGERIPLVIVGAKARRSFRTCLRICALLGQSLPEMVLVPGVSEDEEPLREIFPSARIENLGEPRWDQVAHRARQGHPRARALIEAFQSWPRPWGVLGQIWPQDLQRWDRAFSSVSGTLWVVPHRVDSESVSAVMDWLKGKGLTPVRTSLLSTTAPASPVSSCSTPVPVILVDEIGFLLELYAQADWVYIGGGFGAGVHSTIEPAIFGLPISCGPARSHQFPEIDQIAKTEQLRKVESPDQVHAWLLGLSSVTAAQRLEWRRLAQGREGATRKIHRLLSQLVTDLEAEAPLEDR